MGASRVRGGPTEEGISNEKVKTGCRCPTDWRLFQGWRDPEFGRNVKGGSLWITGSECRPGRGVIKEGGRLKLDPRRLTRETTRQLGSPQNAAANESTHFTQVSFLSSPLVSVSGRRT